MENCLTKNKGKDTPKDRCRERLNDRLKDRPKQRYPVYGETNEQVPRKDVRHTLGKSTGKA